MYPSVTHAFDRLFTSWECGYRKPEAGVFAYVARSVGIAPEAMMFFDDMAENVEAAERAGLRGVLVRSPWDVRRALHFAGCVLPGGAPG